MTDGLDGTVALITGAGSPLGRACAVALAESGARVVLTDRDIDALADAAASLDKTTGVTATTRMMELNGPEAADRMFDMIASQIGRVRLLVNCAEEVIAGPALSTNPADWQRIFATNVYAIAYSAGAFARQNLADGKGAVIVNVSSAVASRGAPGLAIYAASKAAVDSLTKTLCLELGPHGIRVNAVAPALTIDPPNAIPPSRPAPLGRRVELAEIADAVAFLCSDRATYITGQVVIVDGGRIANGSW